MTEQAQPSVCLDELHTPRPHPLLRPVPQHHPLWTHYIDICRPGRPSGNPGWQRRGQDCQRIRYTGPDESRECPHSCVTVAADCILSRLYEFGGTPACPISQSWDVECEVEDDCNFVLYPLDTQFDLEYSPLHLHLGGIYRPSSRSRSVLLYL